MVNVKNGKRGFGLIEILVGLSILSLSFFSLLLVGRNVSRLSASTTRSLQADFLLEEGLEALRSIRDRGWTANIANLSLSSTSYYLDFSTTSSRWTSTTTAGVIDETFWRTFVVSSVSRDASDDITLSGGTVDPNTKKFTVILAWKGVSATTTSSISTYLTNYFND
ncbi:MAG TPA: prepilin-type N-terminal cleavage/methylation domain-containing protein [Candidatus Paceibacterota bacterium]